MPLLLAHERHRRAPFYFRRPRSIGSARTCPDLYFDGRAGAICPMVYNPIDVDMLFSASEVDAGTIEAHVASLGREGMPNLGHWPDKKPAAPRILVADDQVIVVKNAILRIPDCLSLPSRIPSLAAATLNTDEPYFT